MPLCVVRWAHPYCPAILKNFVARYHPSASGSPGGFLTWAAMKCAKMLAGTLSTHRFIRDCSMCFQLIPYLSRRSYGRKLAP